MRTIMSDGEISKEQERLLELLYDGNSYYLNMGTVNTYDQFYELYKAGYVRPAPNYATWCLTIKGYDFMKSLLASREYSIPKEKRLQLFAFERGMEYAKRSSQHKITKQEFLQKAIADYSQSEEQS